MRRVDNPVRVERLMGAAVSRLSLDLSEISVLTEAASGNFAVTALLAALAGSPRVVALVADSAHGSAKDVSDYVVGWARRLGVADRIEVTTDRIRAAEAGCSLITNLGFVRPIDPRLIAHAPSDAVVALMWEPWEFRPSDIDLAACQRRQVPVVGTCETDPRVGTFGYIGLIALKLLLENEIEMEGGNLLVIGTSPFLEPTVKVLRRNGSSVSVIAMEDDGARGRAVGIELERYDAVVLVDHRSRQQLIGPQGLFAVDRLAAAGVRLVHVCGEVDDDGLLAAGVTKSPPRRVPVGYMTVTTDYVGPRPVVDLHAAGLKVGEIVIRGLRQGLTRSAAIATAVRSGLALDFPAEMAKSPA